MLAMQNTQDPGRQRPRGSVRTASVDSDSQNITSKGRLNDVVQTNIRDEFLLVILLIKMVKLLLAHFQGHTTYKFREVSPSSYPKWCHFYRYRVYRKPLIRPTKN